MSKYCNLSLLQIPCSYSSLLEVAVFFPPGEINLSSWNVKSSRCDVILQH